MVEGSKGFVVRCIWFDDPNDTHGNCGSYEDIIKNGIITFKKDKIRDAPTNRYLETNFKRSSIKKLIEVK